MTFAARPIIASNGGSGAAKYTGTITQAFYYDGSFASYYGFDTASLTGVTFGSRSPTTVSTRTFATLVDWWIGSTPYLGVLRITGFASDPGVDFITSVTVGTFTQVPTTGSYSYSGGAAQWYFPSIFVMAGSGTIACSMTGN
jgi:hypothetical protein